jgi:hypothetical protein
MKWKVIQDFANVFCQRFIDLPSGYDLAAFAHMGTGTASLDVMTGQCTFNGAPIRPLETCAQNRIWLEEQCRKHRIPIAAIEDQRRQILNDLLLRVVYSQFIRSGTRIAKMGFRQKNGKIDDGRRWRDWIDAYRGELTTIEGPPSFARSAY